MVSKNGEARKCVNTNRASIEESIAGKIDMNSVMKSELNFHGIILTPVSELSGIWLTASQIGYALKYADDKAVQRIYSRHLDEFTEYMTKVVKLTTPSGVQESRVFSLRGAHLIAMFARTPVAKEFRRWILDILDREVTENENASPIIRHFNCRVLYTFDLNGTIVSAQQAREDEQLTSPKDFAEVMSKMGYVIVKTEDFKTISLCH